MGVLDKRGVLPGLTPGCASLTLELGCGDRKQRPDALGVDQRDLPGVDLVGDVHEVLAALPRASAVAVASSHFFEHVADPRRLLHELGRVVAPGGTLEIVVPHFSNAYFHSDYTHQQAFGLYSLSYLANDPLLKRRVPHYEEPAPFTLRAADLRFKSPKAFPVRRLLRRLVGPLVNATVWTREFYEENLCWLLPCYEVRFELTRDRP
ncbi:MAG: methyltransferase domain-containing protein [Myxococcota bacterium]